MNDGAPDEGGQAMHSEFLEAMQETADIQTGERPVARVYDFPHEETPPVRLDAADARAVREAGARFASDLAGAVWVAFMMALAEQGERLRRAVLEAGHGPEQARLAAAHFEAAAREEWVWLEAAGQP